MTRSSRRRARLAGGAPLALLTLAGPFVFGLLGLSPSLGFLVGLGLGTVIAVTLWLLGPR